MLRWTRSYLYSLSLLIDHLKYVIFLLVVFLRLLNNLSHFEGFYVQTVEWYPSQEFRCLYSLNHRFASAVVLYTGLKSSFFGHSLHKRIKFMQANCWPFWTIVYKNLGFCRCLPSGKMARCRASFLMAFSSRRIICIQRPDLSHFLESQTFSV